MCLNSEATSAAGGPGITAVKSACKTNVAMASGNKGAIAETNIESGLTA